MAALQDISAQWFLPTFGDGRYLKQIALVCDAVGYQGLVIPTGRACEDSWLIASALAPLTEKLKFLVAVRPGVLSPTQAARTTATLDRLSNGLPLKRGIGVRELVVSTGPFGESLAGARP